MEPQAAPPISLFRVGPRQRRLRLASGCVLFAYVATHLIDHATGNISLAAMEAVLQVQKSIWQGVVGTALLYAALPVHAGLGVWSLYARRYLGWTRREWVQLVLGLCIPALLANHLAVTRGAKAIFGLDRTYATELHTMWQVLPILGEIQVAVLIVAWTHACFGLHFALGLRPWYPRARPWLLLGAVLLPVLALLGFEEGARTVVRSLADPAWRAVHLTPAREGTPTDTAFLFYIRNVFLIFYAALILLVLAARLVRSRLEAGRRGIAVRYPDGRSVRLPRGLTLLDASRKLGVPHASVCGGRGRCSTCRVRLFAAPGGVSPPAVFERALLDRVGADPTAVRLACQTRPFDDVAILPLIPPDLAREFVAGWRPQRVAEERFIVAVFVDLRGSTTLAASLPPYDAVFALRRFIEAVTEAVIEAGGEPNQFTGDGLLALFGLAVGPEEACAQTVAAARGIAARIHALDAALGAELGHPLRFGLGAQCGRAVLGEIGLRRHVVTTALGDVVNVAARLEQATRGLGCDAAIAAEVLARAGVALRSRLHPGLRLRGRAEPVDVHLIAAADLLI
jgi:adenylate cyclase